MQIKATHATQTFDGIELDDWASEVGFDRNVADELFDRLSADGRAAIGEWELEAL